MDDKDAIIEAQKLLIESLEVTVKASDERNEMQRLRITARDAKISLLEEILKEATELGLKSLKLVESIGYAKS